MVTIRNTNERYGDAVEFSGDCLESAIVAMQNAIRECGYECTITSDDYEIVYTAMFVLELRDDQSCTHTVDIAAATTEEAIRIVRDTVQDEADDWCHDGDWGDDGASVRVYWSLTDADEDEIDSGSVEVDIEPDHESKIAGLFSGMRRPTDWCGDDPSDHDWTSVGEGGLAENPGVWSTGGTSMVFRSHCRCCGLHRTERHTGSQRNPGEHDTVEYTLDEIVEIS